MRPAAPKTMNLIAGSTQSCVFRTPTSLSGIRAVTKNQGPPPSAAAQDLRIRSEGLSSPGIQPPIPRRCPDVRATSSIHLAELDEPIGLAVDDEVVFPSALRRPAEAHQHFQDRYVAVGEASLELAHAVLGGEVLAGGVPGLGGVAVVVIQRP